MSTLTKEWLQKTIAELEEERDAVPGVVNEDAARALAAMKLALASLEANGTLANEGTITATQFKPVADLYGLTSPTGGETSFTFDAVEARDFIDGGWSCQEYVELERFQEAASGNSPVIPDGWALVPVEPTPDMREAYHRAQEEYEEVDGLWSPDHQWKAMLAAAPQQEVNDASGFRNVGS